MINLNAEIKDNIRILHQAVTGKSPLPVKELTEVITDLANSRFTEIMNPDVQNQVRKDIKQLVHILEGGSEGDKKDSINLSKMAMGLIKFIESKSVPLDVLKDEGYHDVIGIFKERGYETLDFSNFSREYVKEKFKDVKEYRYLIRRSLSETDRKRNGKMCKFFVVEYLDKRWVGLARKGQGRVQPKIQQLLIIHTQNPSNKEVKWHTVVNYKFSEKSYDNLEALIKNELSSEYISYVPLPPSDSERNAYSEQLLARKKEKLLTAWKDDDIFKEFVDPIKHTLITDPVIASDGKIYDKESILEYLKDNDNELPNGKKCTPEQLIESSLIKILFQQRLEMEIRKL